MGVFSVCVVNVYKIDWPRKVTALKFYIIIMVSFLCFCSLSPSDMAEKFSDPQFLQYFTVVKNQVPGLKKKAKCNLCKQVLYLKGSTRTMYSFVEIDHEIFSTVILSLPLIQEGQLSVSGKRMCTILVNRLED